MEQALHSFEPTRPEQISHRYLLSHGSPERPRALTHLVLRRSAVALHRLSPSGGSRLFKGTSAVTSRGAHALKEESMGARAVGSKRLSR
jgi:hypothetical protein